METQSQTGCRRTILKLAWRVCILVPVAGGVSLRMDAVKEGIILRRRMSFEAVTVREPRMAIAMIQSLPSSEQVRQINDMYMHAGREVPE
jgi:hypothetical protein